MTQGERGGDGAGGDSGGGELQAELSGLLERAGNLIPSCQFSSSFRLYGEVRRRAKVQQRAAEYIWGTFYQMDQAQYLLDFGLMRERAVELIALLENEEQVRQIQPDLPREEYESFVQSLSSCAYENLAEATGQLEGYNSEGMHACIADGLQICRRTGKLGCINCFREYASDVYLAADDAEIAAHQCRLVMEQEGDWSNRGDRRWLAQIRLAWLDALHGRFDRAIAGSELALELAGAETVPMQVEARIRVGMIRESILLSGCRPPQFLEGPLAGLLPGADECPLFDHGMRLNQALLVTQAEDWEEAEQLLSHWDQRLQRCRGTHLWFETRLRLIAVQLLAGKRKVAERLGKQLEQRARTSHDYLTLRRLQVLLDADRPSPLALVVPLQKATGLEVWGQGPGWARYYGEYSGEAAGDRGEVPPGATEEEPSGESVLAGDPGYSTTDTAAEEPTPAGPLADEVAALRERLNHFSESPDPAEFESLRSRILSYDAAQASHADDAGGLIFLMVFLVGTAEDGAQVWKWANSLAAAHQDNGVTLSVLAALADALRMAGGEEMQERITVERAEQLHRRAMELAPDKPRVFLRAGQHFQAQYEFGEAERCLARAFRLDRRDGAIARNLSELYRATDRPKDALHVLDLSLREGSQDQQAAFDAGMLAFREGQYQASLTYLERYESQAGVVSWVNYYRGVCFFELGNYDRALECVQIERGVTDTGGWHLDVVQALCWSYQMRREEALQSLQQTLQQPFYEIDYLSVLGLSELLKRIATAAEMLEETPLLQWVETRLMRSGLMPDSWFQHLRDSSGDPPLENVKLYRCLLEQPLDELWLLDPDRLPDQENWKGYMAEWGVLAQTEEQASEIALKYQAQCYSLSPEVREVQELESTYTDIPGPVWQAGRFPTTDESESGLSDGPDDWSPMGDGEHFGGL
ncbi:MAG: tetratricopeptide repeat protein [Planctomyces sp.]